MLVQYSREIKHEKYSSVEVITVAEAFKMLLSAILLLNDDRGSSSSSASSSSSPAPSDSLPSHSSLVSSSDKAHPSSFPWYLQLHALISSGRKMLVLVVLYTVSNLCSLYAAGTVGASVSTVFAQLKVLTTAVCGVLVLGKTYSTRKWLCLLVLVVGCVCVSFHSQGSLLPAERDTSHLLPLLGHAAREIARHALSVAADFHQWLRLRVLRAGAEGPAGRGHDLGAQLPAGLLFRAVHAAHGGGQERLLLV